MSGRASASVIAALATLIPVHHAAAGYDGSLQVVGARSAWTSFELPASEQVDIRDWSLGDAGRLLSATLLDDL